MKTWSRLQTTGHLHYTVCLPVCKEQGAEKKVMDCTARAWYKRYAYSAKLDRIVDNNKGPKSTGAKGYLCPGTAKSTGAIFPLPLWVRRLWSFPKLWCRFKEYLFDIVTSMRPTCPLQWERRRDLMVEQSGGCSVNAIVTREIKLFQNYSSLRLLERGNLPEIISKLFYRLIAAHEYFPTCSLSLK